MRASLGVGLSVQLAWCGGGWGGCDERPEIVAQPPAQVHKLNHLRENIAREDSTIRYHTNRNEIKIIFLFLPLALKFDDNRVTFRSLWIRCMKMGFLFERKRLKFISSCDRACLALRQTNRKNTGSQSTSTPFSWRGDVKNSMRETWHQSCGQTLFLNGLRWWLRLVFTVFKP